MKSKETRYTLTRYLFGAVPARLGDEMSGQTVLLMGFAASGSITLGSTLLAGLTLSAALGGPLLGALMDRSRHPGRVLATALGLYAIGLAIIALLLGHAPPWLAVAVALMAGACMPSISGGWSSQLKSFVAGKHMAHASAVDATTFNIAGLIGPSLAGIIAAGLGVHWALIALVVLLVAALPTAWTLPNRANIERGHTTSLLQDMLQGFGAITSNQSLLRATLTSSVSYMGIGMLWVACPLVSVELFGTANVGGLLMSALSVGALIATALYAKWARNNNPDTVIFASTLVLAGAMTVLAFANNLPLALGAMLLAGVADGPQLAAVFAVRHREAPERARSQVFTTGASLKITAAAAGAALAGWLAASSFRLVLTAAAVQLAAAATYVLLGRRRTQLSVQRA